MLLQSPQRHRDWSRPQTRKVAGGKASTVIAVWSTTRQCGGDWTDGVALS